MVDSTAPAPEPQAIEAPDGTPARQINREQLVALGQELDRLFATYAGDRRLAELRWMRHLRQYLGVYDPEIERQIPMNRSRAYPRLTRVKTISVVSRLMNLMFPGSERNWALDASPSAEMAPQDVQAAVQAYSAKLQAEGLPNQIDDSVVQVAVQKLAEERAEMLSKLIDDQLQELGGDQSLDYLALNRKVCFSGVLYGMGVLHGPFVRYDSAVKWESAPEGFVPRVRDIFKPQFDFLPVWDFYPDMTAKTMAAADSWFIRKVMSRSQLRQLANREDFMGSEIKKYLSQNGQGNYKAREFETELKSIGVAAHVNDQRADPAGRYEVLVYYGPISAQKLAQVGVEVAEKDMAEEIEAEIWMVEGRVIKADINAWRKLGVKMRMFHTFIYDEDDTSPVGVGLPGTMRDSQMSVAAATRMLLDNASVTCGPMLEVNKALLGVHQDTTSVEAYKIYERDDDMSTAQFPAVRQINIDSHIAELEKIIEMFVRFADMETFVGPATGGDMERAPSEPMRTAAGASMMRGDAALPFKDIVRNFDGFTQSLILSLVQFNRKFNPGQAQAGDYDVIARGATSLVAKEMRGMQIDSLAQTMSPEDMDYVDRRKFVEARFKVRDLEGMLLPEDEVMRNQAMRSQQADQQQQLQQEVIRAEIRKTLSDAYKAITQGAKNSANADATTANAALSILMAGLDSNGEDDGQQRKAA